MAYNGNDRWLVPFDGPTRQAFAPARAINSFSTACQQQSNKNWNFFLSRTRPTSPNTLRNRVLHWNNISLVNRRSGHGTPRRGCPDLFRRAPKDRPPPRALSQIQVFASRAIAHSARVRKHSAFSASAGISFATKNLPAFARGPSVSVRRRTQGLRPS